MHFGIISPPVPGHVNPFAALGRELLSRGHRVTLFHMQDVEQRVRSEGIEFVTIGESDHPPGTYADFLKRLSQTHGIGALRLTIEAARRSTEMFLRDGPAAISNAGVQALLVDQTEPSGSTLAEHLGVPFVTVCNALMMNREDAVPPPFSGFAYRDVWWAHLRNRCSYALSDVATRPLRETVSEYRRRWKLPRHQTLHDTFSPLAQIAQQPEAFDYPRTKIGPRFHYVGPLRNRSPYSPPFPWERLDGRPLIYASLGTLQGSKEEIFRCFVDACRGLDVQLVLSHGGALKDPGALSDGALVVDYAPQYDLLSRASLTLTHAGLNTVLDALTHGVPLIAVPLTFEQPAIAQRIVWSGAGLTVKRRALQPQILRKMIVEIFTNASYRSAAARVSASIRASGGVTRAADLLEHTIHAQV